MGLGISVGMLCEQARNDPEGFAHHRDGFDNLTRALAAEGVEWREPEVVHGPDEAGKMDFSAGFPYSYLAHLRRAFTLAQRDETVTPVSATTDEQYERDQEKVHDDLTLFTSHLLCHADYAGYYIPVDFDDPLFLPEDAQVDGAGMVGSSQRLLAELLGCAESIGIRLDETGGLSVARAAAIIQSDDLDPFDSEQFAWVQLYCACVASVASGHAIVFC